MSQLITISSINGTPPFQIFVCDFTYTYCEYVTTITDVVYLPYTLQPPIIFYNVSNLILKIIDNNNCVSFQNITCQTPTPTPTLI